MIYAIVRFVTNFRFAVLRIAKTRFSCRTVLRISTPYFFSLSSYLVNKDYQSYDEVHCSYAASTGIYDDSYYEK